MIEAPDAGPERESSPPASESDAYDELIAAAQRQRRFRRLVDHPLFPEIYGRLIAREPASETARWVQAQVAPEDVLGAATLGVEALRKVLSRFRATIPVALVVAPLFIDEKYHRRHAYLDVLGHLDTLVRLQEARVSRFVKAEGDLPIPVPHVRLEIELLASLLDRRVAIAQVLGGGADPRAGVTVNPTQVNVFGSPAAERVHEALQAHPAAIPAFLELSRILGEDPEL
jgi:hypothetical protein